MDQKIEDKRVGFPNEQGVPHNSAIGPADCVPLIFPIAQINTALGDTSLQRGGDRIHPKRLTVRGTVSVDGSDRNFTAPMYVRVVIVAQKDIKVGSLVATGAVDTAHLLKPAYNTTPVSSELPFNGSALDLVTPINTEKFRVYFDRLIKLSPTNGGIEQNPGSCAMWRYTFKNLPKTFSFDDGNGNWVNNFAPFCAIGYGYVDGTSPDVVTTRLISSYQTQLVFEDA